MRKKILFVIPSLEMGGTVSSLNSLYREFSEEFDMYVLPLTSTGKASILFSDKIVPTHRLINYYTANFRDLNLQQKGLAFTIKILKRICRFIGIDLQALLCRQVMKNTERDSHYDIVIGFQEGVATLVASYSLAKKKMAWIHCNYKHYIKECKEESKMYSRFDKIICVSSFTASIFESIMPEHRAKVSYIYNIYNEDTIRSKSKEKIEDSRFEKSKLTLLSVGRICEIKRYSIIPKIAKYLKENLVEYKWYLIGPIVSDEEFNLFKEGIKKYKLEESVIWLDYKSNPYPYIKSSDLLVCLSLSEACPMVFNEAKMLGTAIISTDFGSAYEFIDEGENGYICDIDNIGYAIKNYYFNNDLRNRISNTLKLYHSPNENIINSVKSLFG